MQNYDDVWIKTWYVTAYGNLNQVGEGILCQMCKTENSFSHLAR